MKKNPSWSAVRRTKTYDVWSKPASKEDGEDSVEWRWAPVEWTVKPSAPKRSALG